MAVIDRTITAMDSNETSIIYFCSSKAFDTLHHSILLSKLHLYGMGDAALKLTESYLKIENHTSFTMIQSLKP